MYHPANRDRRLRALPSLIGVLTIAVLPAFITGCTRAPEGATAPQPWPPEDIAAGLIPLPRDDPRAGAFPEHPSSRERIRLW